MAGNEKQGERTDDGVQQNFDKQDLAQLKNVTRDEIADPSHIDEQRKQDIGPQMSAQECSLYAQEKGFPLTGEFRCDQSGQPGKQEDAEMRTEDTQASQQEKEKSQQDKDVPADRWTKYDWAE